MTGIDEIQIADNTLWDGQEASIREEIGAPADPNEPFEAPVGYLLSVTNAQDDWLIDGLVRPSSINLLVMEGGNVQLQFQRMGQSVSAGTPFFGAQAKQGTTLVACDRADLIFTDGYVAFDGTLPQDDPTYLPLVQPIPPNCGFVKELIKSGVKLAEWTFFEAAFPKPEGEDLVSRTASVIKQFDYVVDTDCAVIIHPDTRCHYTLTEALRALKQAMKSGRIVNGYQISLFVLGGGKFGFRWRPMPDVAGEVSRVAAPVDRGLAHTEPLACITWDSCIGDDHSIKNYWNPNKEIVLAEYERRLAQEGEAAFYGDMYVSHDEWLANIRGEVSA